MSKAEQKTSGEQDARLTIAYLASKVGSGVEQALWTGIVDAARERGVNLICFVGERLRAPDRFEAQGNVLYDLVDTRRVDGLVIWSSLLGMFLPSQEMEDFVHRFRPLPMVSVGRVFEGIPGIFQDNYQGMHEAIAHLIEAHDYRRIAFIRGPEGHAAVQERYQAYVDGLTEAGLPVDPNLVSPPQGWEGGAAAMDLLLDERGLRPSTDFEAVVGANDSLALGAMAALQARGVRVPDQVAVVGFDDEENTRVVTPPLTTVQSPHYERGQQAVETLLAMIAGEEIPEQVVLPSKLIVRESCGCLSRAVVEAAAGLQATADAVKVSREKLEAVLATRREEILAGMAQAVGELGGSLNSAWARQLLDGFAADLAGESAEAFLFSLDEVLYQVAAAGGDVSVWQGAVSALRRQTVPYLDGEILKRAEDLWQQARVMIGEAVERARVYQALQTAQQAQTLRETGAALLTTFSVADLMDTLAQNLPRLGISSCYLALYEDPQPYRYPQPASEWSRLVLAYTEKMRIELEPDGRRFRSRELVPEGVSLWERQYGLVVEPLYFQESQLGFLLLEVGPRQGAAYETLRTQISSALQGALLVQRVQDRSAELARQQYILDTFMENVPDSIYFKDLESRITRANRAHASKLGFSDPTEEVGKSDFDFFPEEQAQGKYEQEQEIIRTGQPVLNVEEPDGLGHWTLTTKMPLRDENGKIIGTFGISRDITALKEVQAALEKAYAEVEQQVQERTAELKREQEESARLQQEVIEAQQMAIQELSTPIIPVQEGVIVMPLIGSIDTLRAKDVTRSLLAGIREHSAKVVILDITGVPIVDSGVAAYLNRTIQAARLKGARTIVTGISEAVAETIVDLGIDWSGIETLRDLQTGLRAALGTRTITEREW